MLATTRLHDLGPALSTYLPALAQTLVVPRRCCWCSPGPTCCRRCWSR
ncbi:hypothetical protein [Blastococcus brunescens]|uniref:Uncharacterized protein n=1 Tax=Blastococcus brunescens TaxID=1564165 RepID=A0ABZ1AU08_9ACTN|nr:hypothetical protein [Blastococcus sp. BMG 8361]WRL62066.1 hypothetical protein U6N30_18605 [Blastococcus sp. BMG 8361]